MAAKVNLVLDDDIKEELAQLVPAGERNRFTNEAVQTRRNLLKRQRTVDQLETLRRKRMQSRRFAVRVSIRTDES